MTIERERGLESNGNDVEASRKLIGLRLERPGLSEVVECRRCRKGGAVVSDITGLALRVVG